MECHVWKLTDNRFYIGRVLEGPWVKQFPMERLIETRPWTCFRDEENLTREYVATYGFAFVRGGPWGRMDLPIDLEEPRMLARFRRGECGRCGFANHPVYRCYANRARENRGIIAYYNSPWERRPPCILCHNRGHNALRCYPER